MTVDAGRFSSCLSRSQLIDIDACTQCAECISVCPVQEVTANPSISPVEKIRLFREFIKSTEGIKARIAGVDAIDDKLLEHFVHAVYECTTCGACGQSCAVGINTQRLWPTLRREMVRRGLGPIGPQALLPAVVRDTGNVYNKPASDRFAPWLPSNIEIAPKAEIGYYAGCTGCYESQPMVLGDVRVMAAAGRPFTMLPAEEEVCCGFPLFITGQHDMLEGLVKRLVAGYERLGVKTLICSCPCCVNIMARDWPLLNGKPLPFRIRHITQYAADSMADGTLVIKSEVRESLIYHDPCYLSRGVGVIEEPRTVLRGIPGVRLMEFSRNRKFSRCCGAGGAARKVYSDTAIGIGRLAIDEAVARGADRLILSCPACYAKVHEAMQGYERQIVITDIMELLSGVV